ncbi:hypothetical protein A500_02776 [Clostridium sartagoforme AAU1]|uniref:DUF5412 domain-containing protein n=1 Tax=Clostridium sartagoforme AAU1 TaxID=1202534 RepID=R9CEQ2_9CLOT|nr:DUF5412 family protein [Clostridium sartagoforme]EOR27772.1 hypothetical protein A500_02776 [Clostridium sartagoforme AAU1]
MEKFNDELNEDEEIKRIKRTSTIALVLVLIILSLLIGGIVFLKSIFSPSKELINQTESMDGKYKIEAYLIYGGATTDWAVRCYLKIDNKFGKKVIYNDYHIKDSEMIWEDNDTVYINGHKIELPDGKYDFRYD